ncbi:MAG: hypothetical protein M3Z11_04580 [Candidatus Dormibacteraeota bacterium]|nr:hypothetical protein [Candidatus Dormibacteraeota bacterium]
MEGTGGGNGDEVLVRKAVAESRLMSGENPASLEPGDVLHWLNVYGELVAFKSKILAEMRSTLPRLTEDAASEVAQVDVALVERQKERYEARLGHWEQRAQEIAGIRPKSTQGET